MPLTDVDRLRSLLGERIPSGSDASSTLFSDEEIEDYLVQGKTLRAAAYLGWVDKASEFSNLVDVGEGNSTRAMSDLLDHAQKQVKLFEPDAISAGIISSGGGRVRIRKIVRTGGAIL